MPRWVTCDEWPVLGYVYFKPSWLGFLVEVNDYLEYGLGYNTKNQPRGLRPYKKLHGAERECE